MLNSLRWQFQTATIMALAITAGAIAPVFQSEAALAQYDSSNSSQTQQPTLLAQRSSIVSVPVGTSIQVRFDEAEKVIVTPQETKSLTLLVSRAVTASNGTVLVPAGSQIVGQLQPARGGTQFVASQLIVNPGRSTQQRYSLNGRSRIVTRTERVRRGANAGGILRGAAIGGAAAAALAALTGDRALATEEILGGTGLGALGGLLLNRRQVDVVVVYPNQDLAVRLDSALALR